MAKKKKIPQIVKDIRNFKPQEINWATQKLISYSQLSMFIECPKKWSLQYREGHQQFIQFLEQHYMKYYNITWM
jgi:hypothetical protein